MRPIILCLVVVAGSSSASAQPPATPPTSIERRHSELPPAPPDAGIERRDSESPSIAPDAGTALVQSRGHVRLELGYNYRTERDTTAALDLAISALSQRLDVRVPVYRAFGIDIRWAGLPVAWVASDRGTASAVRLGNPHLGLSLQWAWPTARLRTGAGVVLPFAHRPSFDATEPVGSARAAHEAYQSAVVVAGGWDGWLYRDDTFALTFPGRFDVVVAQRWVLTAELAITVATASHGTFDAFAQVAGEAGAVFGPFSPGVRAHFVTGVPADTDAPVFAVGPFAAYRDGLWTVRLDVTISAIGPIAPGWGVRLGGGLLW